MFVTLAGAISTAELIFFQMSENKKDLFGITFIK
jgi:hypothetical protein